MKRLSNPRGQAWALLHGFCRASVSSRADAKTRSICGRLRAILRYDREGQSLAEFALVLPILMMVLTGIFVLGTIIQNQQQLTYVENQGLITLQQLPNTASASDPCSAVATAVIGAAANLKTSGSKGIQMSIQFGSGSSSVSYPSSGTTSPTGFSCSGGSSYAVDGTQITLTVTYPCTLSLIYGLTSNSCQLIETKTELI